MIKSIIKGVSPLIMVLVCIVALLVATIIKHIRGVFRFFISDLYYEKFGRKCECGDRLRSSQKPLGVKYCDNINHEQDTIKLKRDNRLKSILK